MRVMEAGEDPSFPSEIDALRILVSARSKRKIIPNQHNFVKKLDNIPLVDLPTDSPCRTTMNIVD